MKLGQWQDQWTVQPLKSDVRCLDTEFLSNSRGADAVCTAMCQATTAVALHHKRGALAVKPIHCSGALPRGASLEDLATPEHA